MKTKVVFLLVNIALAGSVQANSNSADTAAHEKDNYLSPKMKLIPEVKGHDNYFSDRDDAHHRLTSRDLGHHAYAFRHDGDTRDRSHHHEFTEGTGPIDLQPCDLSPSDIGSSPSAVPLPAAAWLMLSGLGIFSTLSRRRRIH